MCPFAPAPIWLSSQALLVADNYPRASWMVPSIFRQRPALRVLQQQQSVLIQQFCGDLHWHNFVLFGPEQMAYYWEPMHGTTLGRREEIVTTFAAAAPEAWKLESIQLAVQSDGYSCGDWAHYFRCRVLE